MSNDDLNFDRIRARAERRVKKRAEFLQHLAVYAIVNGFLFLFFLVIAVTTGAWASLIVPFLSMFGWGIGLAIHGMTVYVDTTAVDKMREREIDREIEREMERREMAGLPPMRRQKAKRDQVMRLSDDGELVPDDDLDEMDEQPRSRSRRGRG